MRLAAVRQCFGGARPRPCVPSWEPLRRALSDVGPSEAVAAPSVAPVATPVSSPPPRRKHEIPRKRAMRLLREIEADHVARAAAARASPDPAFRAGDAIEVKMLSHAKALKPDAIRGVVLARKSRGMGSSFLLRNVINGEAIEWRLLLHDPLIKEISVIKRAFIHKGKYEGRAVRRNKLYWLRGKDPSMCAVK